MQITVKNLTDAADGSQVDTISGMTDTSKVLRTPDLQAGGVSLKKKNAMQQD